MYKPQRNNLRIALMTHDKKLGIQLSTIAFEKSLIFSVENYNHLLSESFDILIVDSRDLKSSKFIISSWDIPRILMTDGKTPFPDNISDFHSVLLTTDLMAGLDIAIDFSMRNWKYITELNNKISELEYQTGCRRFIIMAELLVIKWFNCTEKDAWDVIRSAAMDAQCRVEEICIDILSLPDVWHRRLRTGYKVTVSK